MKKELAVKLPVCLVFLLLIGLAPVLRLLRVPPGGPLMEQVERKLRPRQQVPEFLSDRTFPGRSLIIKWSNHLFYAIFNVSPSPLVLIGKNGWLFQPRGNVNTSFNREELELWGKRIEERYLWLKKQGVAYMFIPVPTKSAVYPEFLPESHTKALKPLRLEQLVRWLRENTSTPVLDLRTGLFPAKERFLLYMKTDSHWNELGACIASGHLYQETASLLFPGEPFPAAMAPGDFRHILMKNRTGGNLAMMLNMENTFFQEERVRLSPRRRFRHHVAPLPTAFFPATVKPDAFENHSAPLPSAVMLHDSFGQKIKPYLAEYFSRILFVRDWSFTFHSDVIRAEKPRIVLDEMSEHFLYDRPPVNPPGISTETDPSDEPVKSSQAGV